jgi:hypothetical protein
MAGRFPLLLDEHIPQALARALRERGWAVVRVVDLKRELGPGADDEQVFTYASKQGYVVLSSDERALWRPRLHSEHGDPFPGMLCWPQRHRDREKRSRLSSVSPWRKVPSPTGTASSSRRPSKESDPKPPPSTSLSPPSLDQPTDAGMPGPVEPLCRQAAAGSAAGRRIPEPAAAAAGRVPAACRSRPQEPAGSVGGQFAGPLPAPCRRRGQ